MGRRKQLLLWFIPDLLKRKKVCYEPREFRLMAICNWLIGSGLTARFTVQDSRSDLVGQLAVCKIGKEICSAIGQSKLFFQT